MALFFADRAYLYFMFFIFCHFWLICLVSDERGMTKGLTEREGKR